MLRATLLCLFAVLATTLVAANKKVKVKGLDAVVPELSYREVLRKVNQANERARSKLALVKPRVTDPQFHSALVLGVVDAAANRLVATNDSDNQRAYVDTLNYDMPLVYQSLDLSSLQLQTDLDLVQEALQPVVDLVNQSCQDLDDKDCNVVVQLALDTDLPDDEEAQNRRNSVEVLKQADNLATSYLNLHEDVVSVSNRLSGLGYVLNNVKLLGALSRALSDTLAASQEVVVKKFMW